MKSLLFALLLCSASEAKEFKFTYILVEGRTENKLQYKTDAATWEEAFKRGADFCFDFFVKREKTLTEDKGLDIIDSCANPR